MGEAIGSVGGVAAGSLTTVSSVTQPTETQIARFEQQVQLSTDNSSGYYEAPATGESAVGSNWRVMMHEVGELAEHERTDSTALESLYSNVTIAPSGSAIPGGMPQQQMEVFTQEMSKLTQLSYSTMNISLITSAERLAGENVRTLYQVG